MSSTTSRLDVFDAIEEEREYQTKRWGRASVSDPKKFAEDEKPVAAFVTFAQHYLDEARRAITKGHDWQALCAIRKVTTLGVACMEQHGAPTREQEDIDEYPGIA